MFDIPDGYIIVFSAAFGGAGVKLVESIYSKYSKKSDSTAAIRQELREEAEHLRVENQKLLDELDEWRQKYFEILQELNELRVELRRIKLSLDHRAHTAQEIEVLDASIILPPDPYEQWAKRPVGAAAAPVDESDEELDSGSDFGL